MGQKLRKSWAVEAGQWALAVVLVVAGLIAWRLTSVPSVRADNVTADTAAPECDSAQ